MKRKLIMIMVAVLMFSSFSFIGEVSASEENQIIINGVTYNEESLNQLLNSAEYIEPDNSNPKQRFAAAGIYFIPGVGEVALIATGAIVIGGITIKSTNWAYKTIKAWLSNPKAKYSKAYGIPERLLDNNGKVKLKDFTQKVKGKNAWKNPKTGFIKEKDRDGHGGKKWKIKDKNNKRKASTDGSGKILSK